MNIHAVLITYALDPAPLVKAIMVSDLTLHLFTHSAIPEVVNACGQLVRLYGDENIRLNDYRSNRGLARSWNDGILAALDDNADAIIILNDDVTIASDDFARLAEGCHSHPDYGILTANGFNVRMDTWQDLAYAVFGINACAVHEVGLFDENYWPLYGEDVDYSRRMALAGVPFYNIGETDIIHRGSATVGTVSALAVQNQATFAANERYHRAKHGGGFGHEVFQHPFDDPALSWRISRVTAHNPYPGHGRAE